MRLTRTTRDVDMILHFDSGAATFAGVQQELERLGYALREPVGDGPVHRFARGSRGAETIDVMVADRLSPKQHPKALRRKVFAVPGAAYVEDSRDRDRHLDDAAVLACAVTDPIGDRARMIGSDRQRIEALWKVLKDLGHKSWIATGTDARRAHAALRVLVSD